MITTMQEHQQVTIYTRGIGMPGVGAFGVLLVCDGHKRELSGGEVGASNNRMDLLAAVEGLSALKWPCLVNVFNSNGYLIDGIVNGWAVRWQKNGWKSASGVPTAHSDLWENLLALCADHTVQFNWLPANEDVAELKRCDLLAREYVARHTRNIVESRS